MILNKDNAVYYFESSNILVGLGPDANGTLLISSHYDSAVLSHGVTDDGIATGAMMSVISALSNYACHNLLQFRVLFLFNNAEEVNLLGSLAFTKDKQFDSVSAFLNFGILLLIKTVQVYLETARRSCLGQIHKD